MKRFFALTMVMLIITAAPLAAKKVAELTDILKPQEMLLANDRLFIVQGYEIFIYSLKDYSLIKKFGRQGEGPSEFPWPPSIFYGDGVLTACQAGRADFYSTDGEFKGQYSVNAFTHIFVHVNGMLVSCDWDENNDHHYYLFKKEGKAFNKDKELLSCKGPLPKNGSFNPIMLGVSFFIDNQHIFFYDPTGTIHCFDANGKKIRTIAPDIERIPFTATDKEEYLESLRNGNRAEKMYYELKRKLFKFPDYFPPYHWFEISDSKIYLGTYKKIGKKYECLILDTKGKLIRKAPLPEIYKTDNLGSLIRIKDDKIYQLVENDDCWDLHVTPF